MENRELATTNGSRWTAEQIDAIKKTVALNANDSELTMFLSLASKYDLDPFAHEIWFVNIRGRNTIITGRDGYLKIANCNSHYQGMKSDVVYTGDKFFKDETGIHHAYNVGNRGKIIGAYAEVYRDDRKANAYFFAPMSDYNKHGGVWEQYPHAMIAKVAEAAALKRAFSISGLVTEDEIALENEKPQQQQPQQLSRKDICRSIWLRYLAECNNDKDKATSLIKSIVGDKPSSEWTDENLQELTAYISDYHEDTPEIVDEHEEENHNGN